MANVKSNARARYVQFFNDADKNKDGFLDLNELVDVMRKMGFPGSDYDIKMMFHQIDTTGDNKISIDEFITAMEKQPPAVHSSAYLRGIFRAFDKDGNGEIDHDELKVAFQDMGQIFSDDEIQEIITLVDEDGSGTINYEEFITKVTELYKM